ncbi:MAG TPA: ACP S-malonyltransferase [Candidatus Dormibacteraeota bacterium]|nr:ACP S-malonyltransferase [Candidatus Dormibacteraeota bacterium]
MPGFAFLFPGQGSQHAGMGVELLLDPEVAGLADRCSRAAGIDLRHLLTEAADDELVQTANAQPALLFAGVALARLLERRGIRPTAAAGHSVGEYTALCAAGAIEPEEAVRVVVERGRAMAEAAPPGTSSMAAVLGLGPQELEAALIGVPDVWPANYNTPAQTVVAGTMLGLERARERLQEAGARRVVPLNVAAAFHTPLMEPAGGVLRSALDQTTWRLPAVPVVANLTAEPYRDAATIPAVLERQLSSPVRWSDCVRRLVDLGCDRFLEVGPKRALTGMMRELSPGSLADSVGTPGAVDALEVA